MLKACILFSWHHYTGIMLSVWDVTIVSLLLSCVPRALVRGSCPSQCICASDILSCSSLRFQQLPATLPSTATVLDFDHNQLSHLEEGSFAGLPRLQVLHLAHNQLSRVTPGAFLNASGVRHLDLSSNLLHSVEQHYFKELVGLEELLLFNNRITQVESRALAGLGNLHKLYLSHNLLTDFPFFSIQEHSHPLLRLLDLSSNRMPKLPTEDIWALPAMVQSALFLHNNTLICTCSMYALFVQWERRGFPSLKEYTTQHTCLLYGEQRATVRFFQHRRVFENCTLASQQGLQGQADNSLQVHVGDSITLECRTSLRGQHIRYLWVSPNQEYIAPPGNNASLRMHSNGSLEVMSVQLKDAGVYWCMALNRLGNDTGEVNLTVVARYEDDDEHFNTGFTTLLGCVLTLVLVLTYLYTPPCHCFSPKQPAAHPPATPGNEGSVQPSILGPMAPPTSEEAARKAGNKHVVFMEPVKELQNGRLHVKTQALHYDGDAVYLDTLFM